eukprot:TRINITY_DN950_c0_g1_i1.p1 TRINITY_DN950_c0_g1~~TRINITY_DN950_c0_g1_i1.p1  ORF type:complete len:171 (-),score=42.81 TRINITY_DN950_c0_g1_i1:107-619(-)
MGNPPVSQESIPINPQYYQPQPPSPPHHYQQPHPHPVHLQPSAPQLPTQLPQNPHGNCCPFNEQPCKNNGEEDDEMYSLLESHLHSKMVKAANRIHRKCHKAGYVFWTLLLFIVIPFNSFCAALFEVSISLIARPWMKTIDTAFNSLSLRTSILIALIITASMLGAALQR